MTIDYEFELNRGWLYNDEEEIYGETNFVVPACWLFGKLPTICQNVILKSDEDVEDFLNWYEPEVDGEAIYQAAIADGILIEEFDTIYDEEEE